MTAMLASCCDACTKSSITHRQGLLFYAPTERSADGFGIRAGLRTSDLQRGLLCGRSRDWEALGRGGWGEHVTKNCTNLSCMHPDDASCMAVADETSLHCSQQRTCLMLTASEYRCHTCSLRQALGSKLVHRGNRSQLPAYKSADC